MFCRNCGTENADEAVFCKECGAKLVVEPSKTSSDNTFYTPVVEEKPVANKPFTDIIKSIPKKFIAIAAGVIAAIIVLIVVYVNVSSTINLDKYVTVTYSGYDGYGRATAEIDWAAIEKKYGSKIKFTKQASAELKGGSDFDVLEEYFVSSNTSPIQILELAIEDPDFKKNDNLSNGDEITYKWDIDEKELASVFKCKIKYSDKKVTVSGLTKVDKFDPFDDLSVEFSGVGPNGKVEYTYDGDVLDTSDFYCDESYEGLSNGEQITIYINDDIESYAENYGKIPSKTEKKYKVEGLGKYATKLSEISDDTLEEAKKEAEKVINDYTSEFEETETLSAVTYVGDYLEVAKDKKNTYSNINTFGMVYKIDVNVQPEGAEATPVSFYYDVRYDDVVVKEDKSCEIDYENYETPWNTVYFDVNNPNSFWGTSSFYYNGFESVEALTNNRNNYSSSTDIEWNVEGVATTAANSEDYICAYSAEREITTDEINTYMNTDYSSYGFPGNRTVIQMIINEMYARHGYSFTDAELTNYFNQKAWYSSIPNKTDDMDGIYNGMSSVEQANVTLLQQYK